MKRTAIGILAHVDSGKTTLSEALLYCSGNISRLGRVDHRDSFLDTYALERDRGITIFSKQAVLQYGGAVYYLCLRVKLYDTASVVVCMVAIIAVRVCATVFHWDLPRVKAPE